MAILVSSFTITRGDSQTLEIARGEDREYRLRFVDDSAVALDLTGAQAIVLTAKEKTGALAFVSSYIGFDGPSTNGTPRFQVLRALTLNLALGPKDIDVIWTDASGYQSQLLVASTLNLLGP